MGAHSCNTHKATPTEMPDTKFKLHQTNITAPPSSYGPPDPGAKGAGKFFWLNPLAKGVCMIAAVPP